MLLENLSVRGKLLAISSISSTAALVLAGAVLVVYEQLDARRMLEQDVSVLAAVVGDRSTAALEFGDHVAARDNLAALSAGRAIVAACLYDIEGALFADYGEAAGCPETPPDDGVVSGGGTLRVVRPVELDGERVGTLSLASSLAPIAARGRRYTAAVGAVIVLAAGVAFVFSSRLQRIVSRPIDNLVAAARRVSDERDYTVRAEGHAGTGELGVLVGAFNQMLETVEEAVAELEAKNAELERFTYTVSHDLKTPLITIKGYLGLLAKDVRAGDVERLETDLAYISDAADRMAQLLKELLELSRIGRLMNEPREAAAAELVGEALKLVAGPIAERGVEVEVGADLPRVTGDLPRLVEVFQNLIENAVKFMGDEPSPRIEVGAAHRDGEFVFTVRDNGAGIEPCYQEKVFGLFERLDVDVDGTGIGLAIVKRIVEYHGGRIWVESAGLGHGSAFRFTLPSGRNGP